MEAAHINDSFFETIKNGFKSRNVDQLNIKVKCLFSLLIKQSNLFRFYYHPLGFIYGRLYEFPNGESIRLHIWDKSRYHKQPLMDIHDHFYIVNSYVVCGKILNVVYKSNLEKDGNYSLYKGFYNNTGDRVLKKTTERIFMEEDYSVEILKNNIYQIPRFQFHSSYVEENCLTCTIVYTENNGTPTPIVIGPLNGESEYYYENREVEDELMSKVIFLIRNQIL